MPFKVEVSGHILGRRTAVHEYPKRDKPSTEDMGRRARRYAIAAYIIGGDYDQQRDELILALETEGPGTLVHPYLGEFQVRVDAPANITERRDRGRICEIEITFVEAGDSGTQSTSTNTQAAATTASTAASDANVQAFQTAAPPAGGTTDGLGTVPSGGFLGLGTTLSYGSIAVGT